MKRMNCFKMILASAFVVALASCEKENAIETPDGQGSNGSGTVQLGLRLEPDTKVSLSKDNNFAWESGDVIGVWVGAGANDAGGSFRECKVESEDSDKKISVDISGGNRYNYAVYPYSVKPSYNTGTGNLTITLPDSYKLSEVADTKTPLPMIAVNNKNADALVFYNVAGMLRLTVNDIPSGTSYLKVDFNGNQVCGEFSISSINPGVSTIATAPDSKTGDVITITEIGKATSAVVNIPLPTGTYGSITVSAWNGSKVPLKAKVEAFGYSAKRKTGKAISTSLTGPLTGVFEVGKSKYVIFSPGNLQATTTDLGAHWTWGFADHQYDYMGNGTNSANNATQKRNDGIVTSNGTIDIFHYSTTGNDNAGAVSANSFGIQQQYKFTTKGFADWGNIATFTYRGVSTTYPSDYWRTPSASTSIAEWTYLLKNRSGLSSNHRYALARINTDGTPVNGIIIFPGGFNTSNYTAEDGVTWKSGRNSISAITGDASWARFATQCTTAGWESLESAGCVFLPAAGYRKAYGSDNPNMKSIGDNGGYKSAYHKVVGPMLVIRKGTTGIDPNLSTFDGRSTCYIACSVRLVHDLN